jgi:hypothetical protein
MADIATNLERVRARTRSRLVAMSAIAAILPLTFLVNL